MRFSLAEIVALTGATVERWPGPLDVQVRPTAAAGKGELWFAMRPRTADCDALLAGGAAGVVLFPGEPAPPAPLGLLRVPSPPLAFYRLASEARARSRSLIAAVTGSAGKSSTKEFLAAILGARYRVTATEGSLNRISDCAELLLGLSGDEAEALVIEMGFGRVGDIDRMAAMAQPHAGIITKVTPDHLDGAGGSVATVAREKARLGCHIAPGGAMVIHGTDPGSQLLPRDGWSCRVVTFGAADVTLSEMGTAFPLLLDSAPVPVTLRAVGAVQAENAAAAALAARTLGLSANEIIAGLERVEPLPRRFTLHRFAGGLTVIDDTFSANADAMINGLTTAAALAGGRRKIAVLSGIAQLEQRSEELHLAVGRRVAEAGFCELFLVAPDARTEALRAGAMEAGLPAERIHAIPRVSGVAATLLPLMGPETLLYAKTSQFLWVGPELDRLVAAIPKRGHPLL